MSAGIITNAGRNLFAAKQGAGLPLVIDRFLLANIIGLDPNAAPNPNEAMPTPGDQVAELPVTTSGYIDPDKVVYSVYMGTSEGTYTFNWVGLLADDDTLVAVRYIEPLTKTKTVGGNQGNAITRNFMVAYTDAQAITNVVVEASTWQFDISAQLAQKSDVGHGHEISDINQLQTQLSQKAASNHGHEISDINQLETQLGQKAASNHGHQISDISQLETQLGQKAASNHGHEISDINQLGIQLGQKAASNHGHAISDIADLSNQLSGKASTSHTHAGFYQADDTMALGAGSTVKDLGGSTREAGYLPGEVVGSTRNMTLADIGNSVVFNAGASYTLKELGAAGKLVQLINFSTSPVTISVGTTSLLCLKGGTEANGTRTLEPKSAATLYKRSSGWACWGDRLT